jgi:glutaredoxin-related protein
MCITGDISHVQVGNEIAFEEVEDGILKSCTGLRNFVQLSENTIIFDNHNHALYFWIDALRK